MPEPRRWFVINAEQVLELDQNDHVVRQWPDPDLFDRLVLAGYPLAEVSDPMFGHRVLLDLIVDNADSSPIVGTLRARGQEQYPLDRHTRALFEQWLARH